MRNRLLLFPRTTLFHIYKHFQQTCYQTTPHVINIFHTPTINFIDFNHSFMVEYKSSSFSQFNIVFHCILRHLYLKVNVSFFLFCFIHPSLFFYSAVYYKSVCFYHKIQSYNVKDFWLLIPLSCFLYHMSLCIIIYILYCILQKDSSYKLSTILGCLFHYIVLLYSRAAPNNRLSD